MGMVYRWSDKVTEGICPWIMPIRRGGKSSPVSSRSTRTFTKWLVVLLLVLDQSRYWSHMNWDTDWNFTKVRKDWKKWGSRIRTKSSILLADSTLGIVRGLINMAFVLGGNGHLGFGLNWIYPHTRKGGRLFSSLLAPGPFRNFYKWLADIIGLTFSPESKVYWRSS